MSELIPFMKEALKIPSVTGYTKEFEEFLSKKFSELGYDIINKKDALIVSSKKNFQKICFCAHLDRIGFIKENDNYEYSTIYFKEKSNMLNKKLFEKIRKRFIGETIESDKNKAIIKKGIIENRKIIFSSEPILDNNFATLSRTLTINNNNISCQLDNVISIAVLYIVCKNSDFEGTIIFSKNEEAGQSSDVIIDTIDDLNLPSNKLLVLDTTTAVSKDEFDKGYIMINSREKDILYNKELFEKITELAEQNNILYKSNTDKSSTELYQVVKKSNNKISGLTIRLPRKNYHTSNETTSLKCINNYMKLIRIISKTSI